MENKINAFTWAYEVISIKNVKIYPGEMHLPYLSFGIFKLHFCCYFFILPHDFLIYGGEKILG